MTTSPAEMLRMLASGVRPDGALARGGSTPVEGQAFAELLAGVRSGKVTSGREVTVSGGADVSLTPDQMQRLSVAADAAEARGVARLLAVVDDKAVVLDVASRTIEAQVSWPSDALQTDIDAVVVVPGAGAGLERLFEAAGSAAAGLARGVAGLPGLDAIRNQSVVDLVSSLGPASDAA